MQTIPPLAERLRPQTLDQLIGQSHLIGKGKVIYELLERNTIQSMILWGPPGVGKTTLAKIISEHLSLPFYQLSAINSGVKDIREVIQKALTGGSSILFIDEIHRFSKSQQDSLLAAVEHGTIYLIGATTENPSFEVISPLLSRCQVYVLESLSKEELEQIMNHAIKNDEILSKKNIVIQETEALIRLSGGDARKLLNILELVVSFSQEKEIFITNKIVMQVVNRKMALYDKSGEQHYDIISAFIKSIRGSDPNASLYWLARMIEGGEDPLFIARRLLILASEDIGNANPTALVIANNCFQAVNVIGYPECELILAQTVTYLSSSPKSNASYIGIKEAKKLVRQYGDQPVPLHLRNAPTKLMKELDYGKNYEYAHDFENNFVAQEFLPEKLSGKKLYNPSNNIRENEIRNFLKKLWGKKYNY